MFDSGSSLKQIQYNILYGAYGYPNILTSFRYGICNKIQKLNFVNNDSYLKLCPIEDCEGIMSFIKGETIFCPTCGLIFCEECLNPIHDG